MGSQDVYKRQAEGYLPNEENYQVTISNNEEIIEITVENDKIPELKTTATTVSYTHLDVYKRQAQYETANKRRRTIPRIAYRQLRYV